MPVYISCLIWPVLNYADFPVFYSNGGAWVRAWVRSMFRLTTGHKGCAPGCTSAVHQTQGAPAMVARIDTTLSHS